MTTYHPHDAFEAYEKHFGHMHEEDLPLAVRQAYIIAGLNMPVVHRSGVVTTPSPFGQCGHCGVPVPAGQHRMAHAVAGFEAAVHLSTGEPLRMLIDHCEEHYRSDYCHRERISPESGWRASAAHPGKGFVGVAGWCEPVERAERLGMVLVPGAEQLARWGWRAMKWGLASCGIYVLASAALHTSQGLQVAHMSGPLSALDVPGTATSGQGFNAGLLRVLSGAEPGSGASAANAAETGTLGISWTMNATAFGSATAATPSVTTAGAIANVNASASITAGYARLVEVADTTFVLSTTLRRYQMDVGAGSGILSFNTLTISSGGACSVTSFTITHGA